MNKYEPTQPLALHLQGRVHASLAREFYRLYGREPFSLRDLYKGLNFTSNQVREAETIRLIPVGLQQHQLDDVVEANMRYWGEPFY